MNIKILKNKKVLFFLLLIPILLLTAFITIYFKNEYLSNKTPIKEEEKKVNTYEKLNIDTNLHKLIIKKFKKNYDHIAILNDSNEDEELELLAIKGNKDFGTDFKNDLQIFNVKINLKDNIVDEHVIFKISDTYRATDIIITKNKKIYIAYVAKNSNDFFFLKLDQLIKNNSDSYRLSNIFSSSPIPPPTLTAESGGKIIENDEKDYLFLSVGSFERSDLMNNDNYNHGSIIKINTINKNYEIFATGLRNPQGLYFDNFNSTIISTDHGPRGGDEINLILKNKDYGWPRDTYGMPYNANRLYWSLGDNGGANYGRHNRYEKPIYAFIPSIGIKSIEKIKLITSEFTLWQNNFIFCSGSGNAIYRAIFSDDNSRLILHEKILNESCRDLNLTKKGKIITNDLKVIYRDKETEKDRN